MKKLYIIALACLLTTALGILPFFDRVMLFASAEGAALNLSPAAGSFGVGKNFTVKLMVASDAGTSINAADGTVSFDPALLSVSSVNKDGSVFNLWAVEPEFSNGAGTVTFGGGSTAAKTSGTVLNIVFTAKKEGSATVSIGNASVLAADGKGTNVLSGSGKATFTLTAGSAPAKPVAPAATPPSGAAGSGGDVPVLPAPDVTSPTHADAARWYPNNNPELAWKVFPSVTGVSVTLDNSSSSDPGPKSIGTGESQAWKGIADGVWYAHIKFKNAGGWSNITHRKILIDTTKPANFPLTIVTTGPTDPQPVLKFYATDTPSGIERYEIRIAGQDVITIKAGDLLNGTYKLPLQSSGEKKILVRAVDFAGNFADAEKDITVSAISMPKILEYEKGLPAGEPLIISGVADPGATVVLKIKPESTDKQEISANIPTDEKGNWVYVNLTKIDKGAYRMAAKATLPNGAESQTTDDLPFSVTSAPFLIMFGWVIIALLFVVIAVLVVIIIYGKRELLRVKLEVGAEAKEMREKLDGIMRALAEEIEEKVMFLDSLQKKEQPLQSDQVIMAVKEALVISEEILGKEIEDLEKMVGANVLVKE